MGKKNLDGVRTNTDQKWEDNLPLYKFDRAEYQQFRLVGDVFVFGRHWVATKPDAIESGKKFPRECPNFSDDKEDFSLKNGCPACERGRSAPAKSISSSKHYLINAIDRSAQADNRRNPIVVLGPLPATVVDEISKLKKLNKERGATDGHHVTDVVNGRDVLIRYNANATPKWSVQLDPQGKSPLTQTEIEYRTYAIETVYPDFKDADVRDVYNNETQRSLQRCGYYPDDDDDGGDGGDSSGGGSEDKLPRGNRSAGTTAAAAPPPAPASAPAAPAPVPIQNLVPANNAPGGNDSPPAPAASALACPHPDADHKFGAFQADPTCMRCPIRMKCIQATEGAGA